MVATLIGIVVGALLGGVAQMIADNRRAKFERRKTIDEQRRGVYLRFLNAYRDGMDALFDYVDAGVHNPDAFRAATTHAVTEFMRAKDDVIFYGSVNVIAMALSLQMLFEEAGKEGFQARTLNELRADPNGTIASANGQVLTLADQMRADLGILF